jgi:molecular chaperone GrpE
VTEAPRPETTVEEEPTPAAGSSSDGAAGTNGGPEATEAREAAETEAEAQEIEDELAALSTALTERTADLQRVQAEYLNYKRRVDRDRELVKQNATYAALAPIIEVLDTIDRAREHGELDGGFKAVAEQLERIVAGVGLVKFGAVGDAFDPTIHEALSHIGEDPGVAVTTCKVIAKAGYRIGDRVVRAAQVLVVDPVTSAEPVEATAADDVPPPVENHDH